MIFFLLVSEAVAGTDEKQFVGKCQNVMHVTYQIPRIFLIIAFYLQKKIISLN